MTDAVKRNENGARDGVGRFLPGNGGGGRTPLPSFFRDGGPDALRHLLDIARGDAKDERVSRAQACMEVATRVYGKPASAPEDAKDLNAVAQAILEMAMKGP